MEKNNSTEYQDAVEYLMGVAEEHNVDYHEFIGIIREFVKNPDDSWPLTQYDEETARDEWEGYVNDPEFWRNFKIVTGLDKPEQEIYPFSCSC